MTVRYFFSVLLVLSFHFPAVADSAVGPKIGTAILAGGCFWCIEADFEKLDGVMEVISAYIGGHIKNPTYKQVLAGTSGHIESVKVSYDANKFHQYTYYAVLKAGSIYRFYITV